MRNNSKLLSEVGRMIELSESNPKKREILKENIKKRLKLNEVFGDDDEDDDVDIITQDDVEGEDGGEVIDSEREKMMQQWADEIDKYNPKHDISRKLKLALLTNPERGIDKTKATAAGFTEDDFLKKEDLFTDPVKSALGATEGEDTGARIDKGAFSLYKMDSLKDFNRETSKGKVFIKYTNKDSFYKWLSSKKSLNSIGLNKVGESISKSGNASLNFLARVLSKTDLTDEEQNLINLASKPESDENAFQILKDAYTLFTKDHLIGLISGSYLKDFKGSAGDIELAVDNTLAKLTNKETPNEENRVWNGTKNISPWMLQVIKHDLIDAVKKKSIKPCKADSDTQEFFERMLKDDKIITIVSKKNPERPIAHKHYASKVNKVGNRWHYLYNNVDDAMKDCQASNSVKSHHMKYRYVGNVYPNLYDNVRIAPYAYGEKEMSNIGAEDRGMEEFDKGSENEIKDILGDAVEFMTGSYEDVEAAKLKAEPDHNKDELKAIKDNGAEKRYDSGLTKLLSTKLHPGVDVVKVAKDNIVEFIYNFFLGAVGDSATETIKDTNPNSPTYGKNISVYQVKTKDNAVRDIEKEGKKKSFQEWKPLKFNSSVLKGWIRDQNEKMMVALKNQSKKPEKEIKDLAEKGGLLIKDDDKSVQNIWKSFQKYLHQNPKATEKIMGLIGATSPEGSEQEVELTLEQRIRAKIQKILRESFVILKEDEVDILDTDLSQQIKIVGDEAKRYELADMDDEKVEVINKSIEKTITDNAPIRWKYTDANYKLFKYIVQVLASLYNNIDDSQKKNVMNQIITSLYGSQVFINNIANKIDPNKYMDSEERNEYVHTAMTTDKNGVLPVEVALNTFRRGRGGFFSWLQNLIIGHAKNAYTTANQYVIDGEKNYKQGETDSFDEPIDDDEHGGQRTLGDTISQDDNKEELEERQHISGKALYYIKKFLIDNNLLTSKVLQLWNLMEDGEFWDGNTFINQLAANKMGLNTNAFRQLMFTRNKIIEKAVTDSEEELINYVLRNADFNIKNTHSWEEYERTGKFNASDWKKADTTDGGDNDNDDELDESFKLEHYRNLSEENIVIMKGLLKLINS